MFALGVLGVGHCGVSGTVMVVRESHLFPFPWKSVWPPLSLLGMGLEHQGMFPSDIWNTLEGA